MDGIFLIVLSGFAALCAALLRLCAALAPRAPSHAGLQGPANDMPPRPGTTPGEAQR